MRQRVYVDSSAYYALADPDSTEYQQARLTFQRLIADQAELYTSNFVAAESHALILKRMDRDSAERFLDRLYAGSTHIIRATEGDERRAREIIHQQGDKEYSLVDAISFAVMERPHLRQAWSYDQHFSQYGAALVQ